MNFYVKRKTTEKNFSPVRKIQISTNDVQTFDPLNYMTEIVMTHFDTRLNLFEFLQTSFHVTRKIKFHE